MSACEKAAEWQLAVALFEDMFRLKLQVALGLLWGMDALSVRRSSVSFAAAISACEKAQENLGRSAAVAWLKTLREGPEEAPQPGIQLGEIIGGSPVISASYGLVILNKPAGERTEDVQLALAQRLQSSTSSVSRLDRPTSGVLTVVVGSKMAATTKWFQAQFASRLVEKEYLCLCEAHQEPGPPGSRHSVSAPLRVVSQSSWSSRTQVDESSGREALTLYEILGCFTLSGSKRFVLVRAEPKTGRMHQIRAHLASIGLPLADVRDVVTFASIASSCAKARQWRHELRLLSSLWGSACELDAITFNAITSGLPESQAWSKGQHLLSKVQFLLLQVNEISYHAAISCQEFWRRAINLCGKLREDGLKPNIVTCNSISSTCQAEWQQVMLALNTFADIGLELDIISFNVAISACGMKTLWELAWSLFQELSASGMADPYTFTTMIKTCAATHWWHVLSLLEASHSLGPSLEVWNAAISSCSNASAWLQALLVYGAMQQQQVLPDVASYSQVIMACDEGSQHALALSFLEELEADSLRPDVVAFGSAMNACAHCGELNKALELLNRMQECQVQANLMVANTVINSCVLTGSWEEALKLLSEFQKALQMDVISYNSLLSALAPSGLWTRAVDVLEEARSRGLTMDMISSNALMSACENRARWQEALQLMNSYEWSAPPAEKPRLSQIIITNTALAASARSGQWLLALSSFSELSQEALQPSHVSYNAVVSACEKGRRWWLALDLYQHLLDSKLPLDVATCNSAALACAAAGQWQEALLLAMTSSSVASLSGAITASAELMQGNEQAQWHESFLEHLALQRKKRLRARALLALALISEPMERREQWKEIFVDAQQMYEKVLNDAHSAMGLTCLTVWSSRAILPFRFSSDTLLALLQKALPSVPPKDLEVVAESVPKELDGQTSFFQLMSWLYPSAKQAIDIEEWQALRRQHCSWAKRCHSLLVLSLIAEPFQHFWREVFLDLAWSAWAGAVAGTRRRRSLCVAQAEFESEADRLSALCGNQVSPQDVASTATAEKEQADKMRGFLRGERIDDTVPITEDGSVRKLHGNENAPLLASWIKRSWLQEASGVAGVVTAHVVMKTPAGKELLNTRKPPGSLSSELGPQMAAQPKAADRPAEPARWVMDDQWRSVFQAWNSAGKTLQLYELGKFEVARQCMGPSVEAAIAKCFQDWLPDSPEQRDMYKDVPEDVKQTGLRRQAIQILGLPEEFCMQEEKEPQATLQMEMELLESSEYTDLDGDGRYLLRTIKEGKGAATVSGLSTVQAHFRIAKLLLNYALKDTRLGLANGPNGLVLRADRTKEPMEFIVGEEAAAGEGDFVPPCIGQCLKLPAGGVTEGTHFEVILRDGVPIREMEKDIHSAFSDGRYAGLPDTSGPVSIRIEVEKVARACEGPKDPAWRGLESFQAERQRAEALEALEEGHAEALVDRSPQDALLQQLSPEELGEFAAAHSACAALTSGEVSARHARCAVQACKLTSVPAHVEEAQALDPQNTALRDQAALLIQKDTQTKSVTTLEALKSLKQDLSDSLEAKDNAGLQMLLEELDSLPLTWEAASETKIGKEVGLCAKLSEPSAERVAELAKSIIARLHKLAKAERPLWVR
eukprot:g1058.t1